jgi:two-component system sensor histidine kinase DesK
MSVDSGPSDNELFRVRLLNLVWLSTTAITSLVMPGIGLLREPERLRWLIGGSGILIFAVTLSIALYAAVDPGRSAERRRHWLLLMLGATTLSVPTVGPLAAVEWSSWAWVGACLIGTVPLLTGVRTAVVISVAATAVSVLIGLLNGVGPVDAVRDGLLITAGIGVAIAFVNWIPIWIWRLLVQAERGRAATAEMVAATERLRFARDVHDLLGHNLTVITLKAELLGRLVDADPATAKHQAAQIQAVASTALDEVRQTVHRYREVDLDAELDSVRQVLESAGIACNITQCADLITGPAAVDLLAVLREATTNILRHSSASVVQITIGDHAEKVGRVDLEIDNDGAGVAGGDRFSSGLSGLSDRLVERGGRLEVVRDHDHFLVRAEVRR